MKSYPSVNTNTLQAVIDVVQFIVRERDKDVRDWNNLQNIFVNGRKVAKIPTGSADVVDGDRPGDFNVTTTYAYYLVDNAGTAVWRRVAVGAW